ncbi:zinc finger MYM-type protein 2 [Lingula anatina]|uniref:Zinc finger MYM-type protein 2 n=1 Tax=Lingula anatina TaxID=7574 RepID=A0A1S3JHJ8_LINAN|nr:zinc finger MYM-type protein 2 [Lingula anatina]|eukprot:XP_013409611.1 zinc finger MYM-type protein 2 [Lingula anatina]
MADATAGKHGMEDNNLTEAPAEESTIKESISSTSLDRDNSNMDVENGPYTDKASESNLSDNSNLDAKSKGESPDSPAPSVEEESNMSAIEDESVLSDQAIQNGVTPPPIENSVAEPEENDLILERNSANAAEEPPGTPESSAEDVSIQQPPVDPSLEAQQQEEEQAAVDAAGVSPGSSQGGSPSGDDGPVEGEGGEGDLAAGVDEQIPSVPQQTNGDELEPSIENAADNAEEDQLLDDGDGEDEVLDEDELLDDEQQSDTPVNQEHVRPAAQDNNQPQAGEPVNQEHAPPTAEDSNQPQPCEPVNQQDTPASQSGNKQQLVEEFVNNQKSASPSPTDDQVQQYEPFNQTSAPSTPLGDDQKADEPVNQGAPPTSKDDQTEPVSQGDAPPISKDDKQDSVPTEKELKSENNEEKVSQQENLSEISPEDSSADKIKPVSSEDAPVSSEDLQPALKTDDVSGAKTVSPMSVSSPAADPMDTEPGSSVAREEPMEVDGTDGKSSHVENMETDAEETLGSLTNQSEGAQEQTSTRNAAEDNQVPDVEMSGDTQGSGTEVNGETESANTIKISKVETVTANSGENVTEIKTESEFCKEETGTAEEGTGMKITSVSGATKTSEDGSQVSRSDLEDETTEKSPSEAKIKKEIFDDDQKEKQNSNTTESPASKDASAVSSEGKSSKPAATKTPHKCLVCGKVGKCKYNIVRNGDTKHLCDDRCFKMFRTSPAAFLKAEAAAGPEITQSSAPPTSSPDRPQFSKQPEKCCSVCKRHEVSADKFLSWQGMEYCSEDCLDKFMTSISTTCSLCNLIIAETAKGKHCIKVGNTVRPFCSSKCMEGFTKTLKVCSYCQKDLKQIVGSFIAPVGNKGNEEFKDFCSQACLKNFEEKLKGKEEKKKDVDDIEVISTKEGSTPGQRVTRSRTGSIPSKCTVCGKIAQIKHEVNFEEKIHKLCSDPCFAAFRYANKLTMNTCDNCGIYCNNEGTSPMFIQFEGQQRRFCSDLCVSIFKTSMTKTASCTWCKSTKSNFDMIERVDAKNKFQLFCSLNCLSLYRVNLQATSSQRVTCDQCKRYFPAQYHLTMSDASVRNFCSYPCVMNYQAQFQAPQRIPVSPASTQAKVTTPQPPRIPPTNQGDPSEVFPMKLVMVGPVVKLEKLQDQDVEYTEVTARTGASGRKWKSFAESKKREPEKRVKTKHAEAKALHSKKRKIQNVTVGKKEKLPVPNPSKLRRNLKPGAAKQPVSARLQARYSINSSTVTKAKTVPNSKGLKVIKKDIQVPSLQPVIDLTRYNSLFKSQKLSRLRKSVRLPSKTRPTRSKQLEKAISLRTGPRKEKWDSRKELDMSVIEYNKCNVKKNEQSVIERNRGNNVVKSQNMSNSLVPLKSMQSSKTRSRKLDLFKRLNNLMQPVVVLQQNMSNIQLNKPVKVDEAEINLQLSTLGKPAGPPVGRGRKLRDRKGTGTATGKKNLAKRKVKLEPQTDQMYGGVRISPRKRSSQFSQFEKEISGTVLRKRLDKTAVALDEKKLFSDDSGEMSEEDCGFTDVTGDLSDDDDDEEIAKTGMISKIIEKLGKESDTDLLVGGVTAIDKDARERPRVRRNLRSRSIGATVAPGGLGNIPIISNVMSLAPSQTQATPQNRSNSRGTQPPPSYTPAGTTAKPQPPSPAATQQVVRKVIVQPPPPKSVKNKSLLCKPFTQTKATSCRPHVTTTGVQTDKDKEPKSMIVPVPVPIYVPVPMAMYTYPTPYPLPIPVPIPVPCFIPTTKKSADSILKQIKEIQERMPADPFEAELLMMAEAVATAEKDDSDSESDRAAEEVNKSAGETAAQPVPDVPVPSQDAFGEDMLQMALRMASEMTDQPMDLETSLEPVPVQQGSGVDYSTIEADPDVIHTAVPTRTRSKGRGRGRRGRGAKRTKVEEPPPEPTPPPPPPPAQDQPTPPDADMHLKYTYGVNAWKHWVIQKNMQLEKVTSKGSKLKHFKTDLLQMTADELNFSLCLFVKEVRKPNGEEYASDSIFYLCLGIQQYLFENGRIDNIFTDFYYEKFTECLHEVVSKYQARLNTAGLLVCRIEEEHLWESKQLGAHSPYVLLNTLVYFNTKYFMLKTPADHMKLSFSHIMKHWKKTNVPTGKTPGRSVYLRYYAPTPNNQKVESGQKRKREEVPVFEQGENIDNPLRCPVKLYEFYLSKCPESIKSRSDLFYLVPERSCVPDSPVWYSTLPLQVEALNKMLARVMMVREVQEAHMTIQPVYV